MTYPEALRYLDSFINYEKVNSYDYKGSLKLDRMKRLSELLGNPQDAIPSIHIAGTKGKGSTAAFIYGILRAAGFKTGLYTSPHLIDFRERIRINDEFISEEDLCRLMEKIKSAVESIVEEERPSFFEVYTALAFLYFKEKKPAFVVYEVGLGGRLDATNVITPLVCAITPLSYEHTDKLGGTLREIASEKCGIIKDDTVCVSAPQEGEALEVIKETCARKNAKLILAGKDIIFSEVRSDERGEVFNVDGPAEKYPLLKTSLIGTHQIVNAAVGIGIAHALRSRGIKIPEDAVRRGIENAKWEGRLEIVGKNPYIVLDGAQNRASARVLAGAIKRNFKYKKLILVFGVSKDKDVSGMLEELLPICGSAIFTKANVPTRALEPEKIDQTARGMRRAIKDTELADNVGEALRKALFKAGRNDLVLITGSLFVVGEALLSLRGRRRRRRAEAI